MKALGNKMFTTFTYRAYFVRCNVGNDHCFAKSASRYEQRSITIFKTRVNGSCTANISKIYSGVQIIQGNLCNRITA